MKRIFGIFVVLSFIHAGGVYGRTTQPDCANFSPTITGSSGCTQNRLSVTVPDASGACRGLAFACERNDSGRHTVRHNQRVPGIFPYSHRCVSRTGCNHMGNNERRVEMCSGADRADLDPQRNFAFWQDNTTGGGNAAAVNGCWNIQCFSNHFELREGGRISCLTRMECENRGGVVRGTNCALREWCDQRYLQAFEAHPLRFNLMTVCRAGQNCTNAQGRENLTQANSCLRIACREGCLQADNTCADVSTMEFRELGGRGADATTFRCITCGPTHFPRAGDGVCTAAIQAPRQRLDACLGEENFWNCVFCQPAGSAINPGGICPIAGGPFVQTGNRTY